MAENLTGAVDVVIPMRNGTATIRQAVASAAAQTVRPRRIIVVDDGSTDDGAALVRNHPLVDVITTPAIGVSHARNTGARAARAEFIAFLDCDDLWRPDKLEKQLAVARRRPEAALVTCDHAGAAQSGELIPALHVRPRYEGHAFQQVLANCFLLGGWSSSMLVRRDALLAVGGYDETLRYFEDADLCVAMAARYPLAPCPEVLTYVIENPASTMRRAATPEFVLGVTLQGLAVIEKWMAASDTPGRLAREAARFILSKFLRAGLSPQHLVTLRSEMSRRMPTLTSRIARSTPHLGVCLLQAGLLSASRMFEGALRYRGSRTAMRPRRPSPVLTPRAETTA